MKNRNLRRGPVANEQLAHGHIRVHIDAVATSGARRPRMREDYGGWQKFLYPMDVDVGRVAQRQATLAASCMSVIEQALAAVTAAREAVAAGLFQFDN